MNEENLKLKYLKSKDSIAYLSLDDGAYNKLRKCGIISIGSLCKKTKESLKSDFSLSDSEIEEVIKIDEKKIEKIKNRINTKLKTVIK